MTSWSEIEGWLTEQQAEVLAREVRAVPGQVVVELGSWMGRSTAVLGEACKGSASRVYAVDHFRGTPNERASSHVAANADPDGVYPAFLRNLSELCLLGAAVIPLPGDLVEVAKTFHRPVGLLFLDADHAKGATLEAFFAWRPNLAEPSVVILHDYNWESVAGAVAEIGLPFEIEHGMAIIREVR